MDIYQEIWNADQEENGVQAVLLDQARDPDNGFVVVNEKVNDAGGDHNLFPEVRIPEAKQETYAFCRRLFDNYTLDKTKREIKSPDEDQEVFDLLDAIVESEPMKVARQFATAQTGESYSAGRWIKILSDVWFTQFDMGSGRDLSAFEHIVVGEQDKGKVSGYHFWYKYHLDDSMGFLKSDDIVYVGPRFEGNKTTFGPLTTEGFQTPEISTIAYEWEAFDFEAGANRPLFKPIGGFWNGCSIEGLLALGTIRFLDKVRAPRECVINGARYELKMFRSDNRRNLRTFYPKFLGRVEPADTGGGHEGDNGTPGGEDRGSEPAAEGAVRIMAALVNPLGHDEGLESVTLLNLAPKSHDLSGWAIRDRNRNVFRIGSATIPGGSTYVVRLKPNTAQLSNKGGTIELLDNEGNTIQSVAYTRLDVRRQGWTLIF